MHIFLKKRGLLLCLRRCTLCLGVYLQLSTVNSPPIFLHHAGARAPLATLMRDGTTSLKYKARRERMIGTVLFGQGVHLYIVRQHILVQRTCRTK